MQTAASAVADGIFEELFPDGSAVSTFVDLAGVDTKTTRHPDLTPAERDALSRLGVEKRRRDWLGGRLAAKHAVLRLAEQVGFDWCPTSLRDVEVLASQTREPMVYSSRTRLPVPVQVSISHAGQMAGAVACRADRWRMGLDLEPVEPPDPALYPLAFRDAEIRQVEAAPPHRRTFAALVLWTAKEAISKALGTGLSVCLQDIELNMPERYLGETSDSRQFTGSLESCGPHFTVHTCRKGDYVLSLAWARRLQDEGEGSRSR